MTERYEEKTTHSILLDNFNSNTRMLKGLPELANTKLARDIDLRNTYVNSPGKSKNSARKKLLK